MSQKRKPRIPTEKIEKALLATNGLVSLAAKRVPCSVTTIYQRARDVQSVRRIIDECRDALIDEAELALRAAVLEKQPWAVALVLKTIGKQRGYVERQEVTGANGGPVSLVWDDGADTEVAPFTQRAGDGLE